MAAGRYEARIPYLPALDGLRAIALLSVLAFHGGVEVVHGGYLPLTAFFVLSGFLITALLLAERTRTGTTGLRGFWERRVRRLVPAALIGLGLVALYVAFGTDRPSPGVLGDAWASMLWMTNWRFIVDGQVYADAFSDPSPLQHYWSLAVEEQFYLLLPLLFVGLVGLARGRRWLFASVVALLTATSVAWMAHLHQPGDAPLRAYFGTDTRAAELLVGVLLATVLVDGRGRLRRIRGPWLTLLGGSGLVGLVASVVAWFAMDEYDDRLYEGGLVLVALVASVVVAACTQPRTTVSWMLSRPTLVWIGRLSYGIYLYHWPVFLWLDGETVGLSTYPLLAVRLAVTGALAWLSWRYVETPIRHGRFPVRLGLVGWANASVAVAGVLVVAATAVNVPAVTLDVGAQEGELPELPEERAASAQAATAAAPSPTSPPETTVPPATPGSVGSAGTPDSTGAEDGAPPPGPADVPASGPEPPPPPEPAPPPTAAPTTAPAGPLRVMVVGDSIARNLATGLARWQEDGGPVVVHDTSIIGCPLSRGGVRLVNGETEWPVPEGCGWWATDLLDRQLAEFRPDVILVHSGLNDAYDRTNPSWDGYRGPGDPAVDAYVVAEWRTAAARLGSTGVPVVWASMPCVDMSEVGYFSQAEADRRVGIINRRYVPAVPSTGATVIDLASAVCPGGYTTTVANVTNARPDGVHLSDVAAEALVRQWLAPRLVAAAG